MCSLKKTFVQRAQPFPSRSYFYKPKGCQMPWLLDSCAGYVKLKFLILCRLHDEERTRMIKRTNMPSQKMGMQIILKDVLQSKYKSLQVNSFLI